MTLIRIASAVIVVNGYILFASNTAVANTDLLVCLAYQDRAEQVKCCAEFEIPEALCSESNKNSQRAVTAIKQKAEENYFFCKFKNLDGTGANIAKWGKGTDFIFVPSKNVWEWRSEDTVQTIDKNGKYRQKALKPYFDDQIGKCGPGVEQEYKKKIKEIMDANRR